MWAVRCGSPLRVGGAVDLRQVSGATLRFWTWFDIEADYDYGYVEVSVDGGKRWSPARKQALRAAYDLGRTLHECRVEVLARPVRHHLAAQRAHRGGQFVELCSGGDRSRRGAQRGHRRDGPWPIARS